MKTNDFYTSIDDAKTEIQKRWQDAGLRDRVRLYLGGEIPTIFHNKPYAVLSRNIATPDIECMRFLELSQEIGLPSVVFEGASDKFVSLASDKMGLVKLSFFDGYDKNHAIMRHYRKIINIAQNDGKKFDEITTLWGENLVEFHHRILRKFVVEEVQIFDDLNWYRENVGGSTQAKDYYKIMFAFFVVYGVQFENYVTDAHEQEFFVDVVRPAFDFVFKEFGVRPLIVELAPHDEADSPYWWCYPQEIEMEIDNVMNVQKL